MLQLNSTWVLIRLVVISKEVNYFETYCHAVKKPQKKSVKGRNNLMLSKIINALSLCICIFLITPVFAGIENRPQNVDDAYVLDPRTATMSLGFLYVDDDGGANSHDVQLNGGIGLFDGFEITFDLPYSFTDDNVNYKDGVNDFTLRPEWMFMEESDTTPAMSLAGVVKFDFGDRDVGSGTTDYAVFFNVSKRFGQWVLHTNIGYNFIDGGENTVFLGWTFDYGLTSIPNLTVVGEIFTEIPEESVNDVTAEVLVGTLYNFTDVLTWDVGIGFGLLDNNIDARITTGLTYEFGF